MNRVLRQVVLVFVSVAGAGGVLPSGQEHGGRPDFDWPVYRGDAGATQYAALAQIHAGNVHRLERVWEYRTGDATARSTMHVNPVVVDGLMYITTPALKAVALDPRTGQEQWVFDPSEHHPERAVIRLRNRGVAYWKGSDTARVFHFVKDRVYAIDARSGALVTTFGRDGVIDLREGLDMPPERVNLEMTSPGAVYQNLLILGSRVDESYGAAPGYIRAYDTVTGEHRWTFRTIPRDGEFGSDTWSHDGTERPGGANAWGGITIDEQRGWVFCATGSATDDFYGGFRKGRNLFANSVLALDAATGERKWHYQTIRHDIWDYDNPPAPILVTLRSSGEPRDVVVQLTKMGFVFVLDRDTGEPIFPVNDLPVPSSTVPGEEAWPTQPVPILPPPLVRQHLTEADLVQTTPAAHQKLLREFRRYVSGPLYTPPTLQGTITTPGHMGGSQWHGGAFDPSTNVLYVNVNEAPTLNRLRAVHGISGNAQQEKSPVVLGRQVYERACSACHGVDRRGAPPLVPPLVGLSSSHDEMTDVIRQGRNSMPGFSQLHPREMSGVLEYLRSPPSPLDERSVSGDTAPRYTLDRYEVFVDEHGVPAISPPWGTLNAVDLVSGTILWKVPLGEYPHLAALGMRNTGTMNFGGAVATAGGVVFIAATADEKIRAFESRTGRLLWEQGLPAGGYATPSTYMVAGRQYLVVAAGGGGKNATRSADALVAFALPTDAPATQTPTDADGWIQLFDGVSLDGWVHLNGMHTYTVEDGAIVGRTVERSASTNSFLVTLREFDDFELELATMVDRVTNQGIQIRSQVRPYRVEGRSYESFAGRVYGPQVEVRRYYEGLPTTGLLYGEALGTGWLSSEEKIAVGHRHFIDEGWNAVRIVAQGARIQTWVNGHAVEDLTDHQVYRTHPKGFIGLQIHGLSAREVASPQHRESGVSTAHPLEMRWRNIRVRPLHPGRQACAADRTCASAPVQ